VVVDVLAVCPDDVIFAGVEIRLVRGGRSTVGGWVADDLPVLLLTTTGRRSGKPHTTPLLFHRRAVGPLLLTRPTAYPPARKNSTKPNSASASVNAMPKNIVVRTMPAASGCRAIAVIAFPMTYPIPMAGPIAASP
jgi:F420H(2)-dependent quinone reductase